MKRAFTLISVTALCLSSTACSGESDPESETGGSGGSSGSSATGGTSGSGGTSSCGTTIVANTANNYSFSSTLSFPPVSVMPDAEISFDWSAVTTDFLGHPVNPMTDIDTVNLMLWKLTQENLQVKLNADDLAQRDLAVIATYYTNKMATTADTFTFTSVGMAITPCDILPFLQLPNPDPNGHPECPDWAARTMDGGFDPTMNTYTVMIATGDELGAGTRMIQAFKLDPTSTNTEVVLTPSSTHLEYSVNLRNLQNTPAPTGTGALTIDWTSMTTNALGNEFIPSDITRALVAHYMQPVTELEAQFLDLDLIPADRWRGTIDAGTTADLSSFTNEAGAAFPGIDGTGTWVLALNCGACRNPAPWYLTILEPCSP